MTMIKNRRSTIQSVGEDSKDKNICKEVRTTIIAIVNQKGGVGKSTTALSLAAGLHEQGKRVLLIDLDAQGNLTDTAGASRSRAIFDVLEKELPIEQAILPTSQGDIIPSAAGLVSADKLITDTGKEFCLREALEAIKSDYDYIVIDTPPSLGILTVNALTAADGAIIPAQADSYSLQGIRNLHSTIKTVRQYCNPKLVIMGILITRYNSRAVIGREAVDLISDTAANMGTRVYATKIREGVAIKESQAMKQNIFAYAPKSNVALDYAALIEEILNER